LLVLEGELAWDATDRELVRQAWRFEAIQEAHRECLAVLKAVPKEAVEKAGAADAFLRWAELERMSWKRAVEMDPLLPRELWPPGYLGEEVWKKRQKVLRQAGKRVGGFKRPSGEGT
jgi:DNA-binding transcriptional regulator PaaX